MYNKRSGGDMASMLNMASQGVHILCGAIPPSVLRGIREGQ